ncbi:MAP kinase kinase kinase51 [Zea mays]|uniref:MAP kinase kinase kinase51 n=1 Tax=Zea mays TaxID=4577 RepID=A0A1D6KFX5_MAIZE|nr:MAP kinase kinase kinase51 [Zea mays]
MTSTAAGASSSAAKSESYLRADKIDLESLDIQLEKQLAKTWEKHKGSYNQGPREDWEIDLAKLEIRYVIAQGTYGTVYRGTYDGQDVADGFASETETATLRASFKQEVAVWHELNHPNVTKFVGASMGTTDLKIPANSSNSGGRTELPPRACCVVVEYLAGGSLKQYLIKNRRRKLAYKVVVQIALDLARGDNCLEQLVSVQVLEGKPYNRKCDVYSFGICLWEIYCCDMPYPDLSFADVSSAVVHQNLRPDIPRCCPSPMANIMRKCWDANPDKRPDMDDVVRFLEALDTSKGGGMIPEGQAGGCLCFFRARGP